MEDRVEQILDRLAQTYPNASTDLKYRTPFELLVAVILSAQSTDAQVNKITEKLFEKYNTPESIASLTPDVLAEHIKGCGLFRNKSKFLVQTSRILLENYNGEIPKNRVELEKLPGVGRKTANVVLGVAFGQNTFPVDTHVHRLAHRLGLASGKTPEQVEKELCEKIPPELWQPCHHWLIQHGRKICDARKPRCSQCSLVDLCPGAPEKDEEISCTSF
ncbi:endonuclease III [Desulfotomaculum defluvii]